MSERGTLTTPNSPMISKSMMLGIGICSPRALPNKRYSLHLLPYTSSLSNNQPQIYSETSASVTTKGVWYPDKTKATDKDPPLYLHISATTQEILDKAIQRINDLIAMDLGPLVEDRRKDFNRERVCTVFIPTSAFANQCDGSANGSRRRFRSTWNRCAISMFEPRWLAHRCDFFAPLTRQMQMPDTKITGDVCKAYSTRNRYPRSDQRSRLWLLRDRHWSRIRGANAHPYNVNDIFHIPSAFAHGLLAVLMKVRLTRRKT